MLRHLNIRDNDESSALAVARALTSTRISSLEVDVHGSTAGPHLIAHGVIDMLERTPEDRFCQWARVEANAAPEEVMEMLGSLWHLEPPKTLISVTGDAATQMGFPESVSATFHRILQEGALRTKAWVVHGGTNAGVMRMVGEAVNGHPIPSIGIATWGVIKGHESLVMANAGQASGPLAWRLGEPSKGIVEMEPRASHLLLVDDGTTGEFGKELALRSALEDNICDHGAVVLQVLVGGGPNSLQTVLWSLQKEWPVLVWADSGRSAAVLAAAHSYLSKMEPTDGALPRMKKAQLSAEELGLSEKSQIEVWKAHWGLVMEVLLSGKRRSTGGDQELLMFHTGDFNEAEQWNPVIRALLAGCGDMDKQLLAAIRWGQPEILQHCLDRARASPGFVLDEAYLVRLCDIALGMSSDNAETTEQLVEMVQSLIPARASTPGGSPSIVSKKDQPHLTALEQLHAAILENTSILNLNTLPIGEMRANRVVQLELTDADVLCVLVLSSLLPVATQLRTLRLAHGDITNHGKDMSAVFALAKSLPGSRISSLHLDTCALCGVDSSGLGNFRLDGLISVSEALLQSAVSDISFAGNNITHFGIELSGLIAVAEGLPQSSISVLNLNWNYLGFDGSNKLTKVLPMCKSLAVLYLDANELGSEGTCALADSFQHMPSLAHLSLRRNLIGNAGASALLAVLPRMPSLVSLNINDKTVSTTNKGGESSALAEARALTSTRISSLEVDVHGSTAGPHLIAHGVIDMLERTPEDRFCQWARVEANAAPEEVMEMLGSLWHLEPPKTLISVTGDAATQMGFPESVSATFHRILQEGALRTKAWVVHGGTNAGVMRMVGEAVNGHPIPSIGIATWGVIKDHESLEKANAGQASGPLAWRLGASSTHTTKGLVEMEPRASHLLLVDDGTTGEFGKELALRSALEDNICDHGAVILQVLVGGGPNSLQAVLWSLQKEWPVLVWADSGRSAAVLAAAHSYLSKMEPTDGALPRMKKAQLSAEELGLSEKSQIEVWKAYSGLVMEVLLSGKRRSTGGDQELLMFHTGDFNKAEQWNPVIQALLAGCGDMDKQLLAAIRWGQPEILQHCLDRARASPGFVLDEAYLVRLCDIALGMSSDNTEMYGATAQLLCSFTRRYCRYYTSDMCHETPACVATLRCVRTRGWFEPSAISQRSVRTHLKVQNNAATPLF